MAAMHKKRQSGQALVYKNKIYVFGGYSGEPGNNQKSFFTVEKFDEIPNKWMLL